MVAAYRQAELPVHVAADVDLAYPPNHEYQPRQADGRPGLSGHGNSSDPRQAEACGPRGDRPKK
jgi:hypothetical protein